MYREMFFYVQIQSFESDFTICQNVSKSLILGLDFMQKHQIGLKGQKQIKDLIAQGMGSVVETSNVCEVDPFFFGMF